MVSVPGAAAGLTIYPPLPANQGLKLTRHPKARQASHIYPPLPANQGLKLW